MEQSTNSEAAGKPAPMFMEHRWGQRKRCRACVYLTAGAEVSGTGRVRDVSSSGAFIETALHLPMHSRVMLNVRGNESATHEVDIAASVARVDNDGIGVEWYETPAGSICTLLGCTTLCAALKVIAG
jgi:hypothetical protein